MIDEIRYQLEFQWLKVSHLGNGMSGKCHLATDFQTEFKFCVKEVSNIKFLNFLMKTNILHMRKQRHRSASQ